MQLGHMTQGANDVRVTSQSGSIWDIDHTTGAIFSVTLETDGFNEAQYLTSGGRSFVVRLGQAEVLVYADTFQALAWDMRGAAFYWPANGSSLGSDAALVVSLGGGRILMGSPRDGMAMVLRFDRSGAVIQEDVFQSSDLVGISGMAVGTGDVTLINALQNTVAVLEVSDQGKISLNNPIGPAVGLPTIQPTDLVTIDTDTGPMTIVASRGTSSLAVLRRDNDGFTVLDYIVDDRTTRFDQVFALSHLSIGDRHFIAASGMDQGITFYEVLSSGKLVFITNFVHGINDEYPQYTDYDLLFINNEVKVIFKLKSELGYVAHLLDFSALSNFHDPTSYMNQLLSAKLGGDVLGGGSGSDILIDNDGRDDLSGGPGGDIFVLGHDGQTDRILDFDPAQDIVDLSLWPMLYSVDQLDIATTDQGMVLTYQNEELILILADAGAGSAVGTVNYRFATRYDIDLAPVEMATLPHDPEPWSAEVLMAGPAQITYEFPHMSYQPIGANSPQPQFVMLTLRDTFAFDDGVGLGSEIQQLGTSTSSSTTPVLGSKYSEYISGTVGHDELFGFYGADDLLGGAGNDVLRGGSGADRLYGGDGQDTLYGGLGDDLLIGGADADQFIFTSDLTPDYDVIFDFDPLQDQIRLIAQPLMTLEFDQIVLRSDGNGTWIDLWADVIYLNNVSPTDLGADQFIFG